MSIKSTIKNGFKLKAIAGVVVGIVIYNVVKTKIPALG